MTKFFTSTNGFISRFNDTQKTLNHNRRGMVLKCISDELKRRFSILILDKTDT